MFVHEKKTYYTIQDYITKGYIEGERVSGTWALTETGMKQLTIRKSRIEKELKWLNLIEPKITATRRIFG